MESISRGRCLNFSDAIMLDRLIQLIGKTPHNHVNLKVNLVMLKLICENSFSSDACNFIIKTFLWGPKVTVDTTVTR